MGFNVWRFAQHLQQTHAIRSASGAGDGDDQPFGGGHGGRERNPSPLYVLKTLICIVRHDGRSFAFIRASTRCGLIRSRSSMGNSMASMVFFTSKPSSVSPSITRRRLKKRVSGSSRRRASNRKSCASALIVRSASPKFWQAEKLLCSHLKSNDSCASLTLIRSFLLASDCLTSAGRLLSSIRLSAPTNNSD